MEKQKITLVSKKVLDVSYFCGSGAGGQARNRVKSGCQIIHRESGSIGRASDSRSLEQNKKSAFERMRQTTKFKIWLNKKLWEIENKESLEESIEKDLQLKNLKFEIK